MHFHQKIHELLLQYRNTIDSSFNFMVRQRASLKDKNFSGGKFAHGLVFQGNNDYCFVGLVNRSGGINATRSVGLVFKPIENGFKVTFDIVFPGEKDDELILFYRTLAKEFKEIIWRSDNERAFVDLQELNLEKSEPLFNWLKKHYPIIQQTAEKSGISGLIPNDEKFISLQKNLKKKLKNASKGTSYWVFQGNPDIYNITNALNAGHLKSWKVAAHKDKIRIGDKVILWQTGVNAGCYALAEITSEVSVFKEELYETQYYLNTVESRETERVKIKIKEYLIENPILWKDIKDLKELAGLKAGNQGTNFSATEEEYNTLLSLITDKTTSFSPMFEPINQILYGPPGTGKTYYLKNNLFDKYTIKGTSISKEKYFEEAVSNLTWWQVIALALLESGVINVSTILVNRWVAKKASLSESKNVRATIWGTLQMHTIEESETVAYKQRQVPLIFDKTDNKEWELLKTELDEQSPELYDILNSVNNFEASPNKTIENFDFVTFHQSFAYEDFIEGIKPILPEEGDETKDLGYTIENGVFKNLCLKAQNDPENKYAIFIDEINRGNVSAIFGELITLIELDKRKGAKNELSIKLQYSKKDFSVPSNLDIYGTMNTADRSVEALDTALRRRFVFKEIMPEAGLLTDIAFQGFNLQEILEVINNRIETLLDRDHTIGHSYFIQLQNNDTDGLLKVFKNNIVPLLQEYFYNDYEKIALVLGSGFVKEKKLNKDIFLKFAELPNIEEPDLSNTYELITDITDIEQAVCTLLGKSNA